MRQIKSREVEIIISGLDENFNMYTKDCYLVQEFSNGIIFSEDADCFVTGIEKLAESGYLFEFEYTGKVFYYCPKEIRDKVKTVIKKYSYGEAEQLAWELVRQAISKSYANI